MERTCIGCKRTLPESEFYPRKQRTAGESPFSSRCKECAREQAKEQHEKKKNDPAYKERVNRTSREHYQQNKDDIRERHRQWKDDHPGYSTQKNRELRIKCLEAYGNKCQCCGETQQEFLAFDHVNGGGRKHRKQVGGHMNAWIVRNKFPSSIRILCHNCNQSLAFYGYCPHQKVKDEQ
jgi:hypothetical protein